MSELITKLEALTGPCRECDREIMAINFDWCRRALSKGSPFRDLCWVDKLSGKWKTTDRQGYDYTASIDAAMTLVPEGMGDEIDITTMYQVARVGINLNHGPDDGPYYGQSLSNSIPIALCIAALRARTAPPPAD